MLSGICQALEKGKRGWFPLPLADSALLTALLTVLLTPPLRLAFLCSLLPPRGLWRPMVFSRWGPSLPFQASGWSCRRAVALSMSRLASPEPSGILPAAPVLSSWTFPSSLWCRQTSDLPQGTGAVGVSGHHAVTWRIGNFWAPWLSAGGKGVQAGFPTLSSLLCCGQPGPATTAWPSSPRRSAVPSLPASLRRCRVRRDLKDHFHTPRTCCLTP